MPLFLVRAYTASLFATGRPAVPRDLAALETTAEPTTMYHLLKGLHAHLTRKDEYSVVIIGLDNVRSRPGRT